MRGVGLLPENENTVHYVTAKICQGDIKHVFDYLITSHLLFWTHLSTGFLKQGQTVYQIFGGRWGKNNRTKPSSGPPKGGRSRLIRVVA